MAAHLSGRRLRRRLSGSGWDRTCWALMRPGAVQTPQSQLTDSVPDSAGQCTAESSDQRRPFTSPGGCGVSADHHDRDDVEEAASRRLSISGRGPLLPRPLPQAEVSESDQRACDAYGHRNLSETETVLCVRAERKTNERDAARGQGGHADNLLDWPHAKETPAVRSLEAAALVCRRGAARPERRGVLARRADSARRPVRGRGPHSVPRSRDGADGALTVPS
jgi:hypothetical protein